MDDSPTLRARIWHAPPGSLRLVASEHGLVRIDFPAGNATAGDAWLLRHFGVQPVDAPADDLLLNTAIDQLAGYFAGQRQQFELPLDLRGTPFQLLVWRALLELPAGSTCSYSALAQRIGRPAAVRAVGAANGANPLSIIVPCHRLVGSDGTLRGYGGGMERKAWLLELERAN